MCFNISHIIDNKSFCIKMSLVNFIKDTRQIRISKNGKHSL